MCLSLCFVLCGCRAMPTAQNAEVKKVIEVSASSLDEIEEMASKDVENTKEKLESERDALSEEILDFDAYTKNVNKVKAYYEDALKQTKLLSIRLREYAYKYAELIMKEDTSYKEKYKDLSGIYEYIYDDAAKTMYDIYDKTLKDMYDIYYDGIINRKALDRYAEEDGFVCYESQMLRNWAAFAGFALTKENNQRPMKLNKVQVNSLAILTTRVPYAPEKDRFVFGVFLVDEAYEGDNREEGYVTTSSKYKLSLSLEEAKKILFWNYYHNENAPEKAAWGQGLHRYITDVQAACILRDIAQIKANTSEQKLAIEFLDYFCNINGLDKDELPELDGALQR